MNETATTLRAKIERAYIEVVPDEDPDTSYLYQDEPDFSERREAFERGDFSFVGVRAVAEITFETEVSNGWIHGPKITTPGLWGIESDSGESYFSEVGADEAAQLVDMLHALGISLGRARYAESVAKQRIEYR